MLAVFCLLSHSVFAYDRIAAVKYAKRWSDNWPEDGLPAPLLNSAVYVEPGSEGCTSFVSQCVIDGGFRFRYSYHRGDNLFTGNAAWQLVHESGMLPGSCLHYGCGNQ